MKPVLLLASVFAALVLATPASSSQSSGRLTIPRLHIWSMPIYYGWDTIDKGPFWDKQFDPRPGQGKPFVIGGHDITAVPGYGRHGPFYYLNTLRAGDLVQIRWYGVVYKYRVRARAFYQPESTASITLRGVEAVWFYTCWPRRTHNGRLWLEADRVGAARAPP